MKIDIYTIVKAYKTAKKIIETLEDADKKDENTLILRKITTVERANLFRQFIQDCEDQGIQLLEREVN